MAVAVRRTRLRDSGGPAAQPATQGHIQRTSHMQAANATTPRQTRPRTRLLNEAPRPIRFAITGGTAALAQLGMLTTFTHLGWHALAANAVAFLLSAQLNFVLSSFFTWRDRTQHHSLGQRWLAFHASIASMAIVNMLVFAGARLALPDLAASALGILLAATGNFILGDRLVFRARPLYIVHDLLEDGPQGDRAAARMSL